MSRRTLDELGALALTMLACLFVLGVLWTAGTR